MSSSSAALEREVIIDNFCHLDCLPELLLYSCPEN